MKNALGVNTANMGKSAVRSGKSKSHRHIQYSRWYRLFLGFILGVLLCGLWLPGAIGQSQPLEESQPVTSIQNEEDSQTQEDSQSQENSQTQEDSQSEEDSQTQEDSQPVILDGQKLFELTNSDTHNAQQRAEIVNAELERTVRSSQSPRLLIEEKKGLPVIKIGKRHLLTVTDKDVEIDGRTPQKQAKEWKQELQDALDRARKERSAGFLRKTILQSLGVAIVALFMYWGLGQIWRRYFVWDEVGSQSASWQKLWKLTLALARLVVGVAAVFYITNSFPWTRQWSFDFIDTIGTSLRAIGTSLTASLFHIGDRSYSITDVLVLIVLLIGLMVAANTVTSQLRSRVLPMTRLNRNAQEIVATVIKYTLITIGTVAILQVWGLDITSLTILASALSVGIGFGFQDIAKNLGSGIVLLFERPIQVGDFVQVGDYKGTIERIGSRSTIVRTLDQVSIIVPNSRFLESEVLNWSHDNPVSRVRLPVGVAYGSDMELVRELLLKATQDHKDILKLPPPRVTFIGFGDSSLDFELWVWCSEPSRHPILISDLYFRIEKLLREHDCEIPFPQRDLHVRSGTIPIEMSPQMEQILLQLLKSLKKP